MIEWHGGINLRKIKSLIHLLDYATRAKFGELKEKYEERYDKIDSKLLFIHLKFMRSSNLVEFHRKSYKLSFDGLIFQNFSESKVEELTQLEKYMFSDQFLNDELFFQTFLTICRNNVEKYTCSTLRKIVLECYKEHLRRNGDEKSLRELKKVEEYEDEYNKLKPSEKIRSKYYHLLRHKGGVVEVMQQTDLILKDWKGVYSINPEIYRKNPGEFDLHELLISIYFPDSTFDEYKIRNKIQEVIKKYEKHLPMSLQHFEKILRYESLKENLSATPEQLEKIIQKSIISQEILFKKTGGEIFITGGNFYFEW